MLDISDSLVRFNGEHVPKKEAKAYLPKPLSSTAKNILSKLDESEYLTVKQLAKKLGVTESAIGFGTRELLNYGYIWNLDEPRQRGVRFGLTAKGDNIVKELAKETDCIQGSGLPWNWEYHAKTKLNNSNSNKSLSLIFPKESPIEHRIAIAFAENGQFQYSNLVNVVMGENLELARLQFDARFSKIQSGGFIEAISGKSPIYQLTEKGIVWANAVSSAYELATSCFYCGKRVLANEPGWDTVTSRCSKCANFTVAQNFR